MNRIYSLSELPDVAGQLIHESKDRKVWTLEGVMGAGKTTLIKALCKELGISDEVSSPTFSLVNEYLDGEGNSVYHFDFYRIEDEEEAMDMGIEEYLYSGNLCLIEWPDRVEGLLPEDIYQIRIELKDDRRMISF